MDSPEPDDPPGLQHTWLCADYLHHAVAQLSDGTGLVLPPHSYTLARQELHLEMQAELETIAAKIVQAWNSRGEYHATIVNSLFT